MKVIDKKKDYYDTAGYIDQSIIFVRKREEVPVNIKNPTPYSGGGLGLLGFCGKFYPYIFKSIDEYIDEKTGKVIPKQYFYFYSFEEFKNSIFWNEKTRYKYRWQEEKPDDYINFFNHWKDSDDIFVTLGVPYFKVKSYNSYRHTREKGTVLTNPSLIDMQFGKVMDAPTAFQTIQFYLTNQLVKTKEPLEIEDKYKILQYGFDKTSFRNPIRLKDLK